MSGKSGDLYKNVFDYIEKQVFELKPARIMADFEAGLRNAINEYYPNAVLHGCWYHYTAAVRRKLLSLSMYELIMNVPSARIIYRMMLSLPLLPEKFIQTGFDIIKMEARERKLHQAYKEMFKYFEIFWMQLVRLYHMLHVLYNCIQLL